MILCLTAAHKSVFNTPRKTFFWIKLMSEAFFFIRKFLSENIFENFQFDSLSFINAIFTLETYSFKPLWYTCGCSS